MILRKLVDTISLNSINNIQTGSITNISSNAESTILTLTASTDHKIVKINCSGTDYAKFLLYINSNIIETKRSGPERSLEFTFDYPLLLNDGDILDLKVIHFYTGDTANFEGTLYSII